MPTSVSDGQYCPIKLYKYREINAHTARIITHNELYFSKASAFKDNWDCAIRIDFSGGTRAQYHDLLWNVRFALFGNLTLSDAKWNAIIDRHLDEQLRDPDAFARDIEAGCFQFIRNSKGVYCLCESSENAQMWVDYAADHRGICLEMAVPEILNSVHKIDYVGVLPVVPFFAHDFETVALKAMFTKLKVMDFEKELRIVDRDFPPAAHPLSRPVATGVVFGARISDDDKQRVQGWLDHVALRVPVYQAQENVDGTITVK